MKQHKTIVYKDTVMLEKLTTTDNAIVSFGSNILHRIAEMFRHEPQTVSYDMLFKDPEDGCARYDDVWGG